MSFAYLPLGMPLVPTMTDELLKLTPAQSHQTIVLVQNRRTVRLIRQELIRRLTALNVSLVLPRLLAVQDLRALPSLNLPSAVPSLGRIGLIHELLSQYHPDILQSFAQPYEFCAQIDQFLQKCLIEGVKWELIPSLQQMLHAQLGPDLSGELSQHMSSQLHALFTLLENWKPFLQTKALEESLEQSPQIFDAWLTFWSELPTSTRVIALGIQPTQRHIAAFLAQLGRKPYGQVIFTGYLPSKQPDETWSKMHPGLVLQTFFDQHQIRSADVSPWPHKEPPDPQTYMLAEALFTTRPQQLPTEALAHIAIKSCASQLEEADTIALAVREALDVPNTRIKIISSSPSLNKQIRLALKPWHIQVDESLGMPFSESPLGQLLDLTLKAGNLDENPALQLSILKNPLTHLHLQKDDLEGAVQLFERFLLRASKDLIDMRQTLEERLLAHLKPEQAQQVSQMLQRHQNAIIPWIEKLQAKSIPVVNLLTAHLELIDSLTTDAEGQCHSSLSAPPGFQDFWATLVTTAPFYREISGNDYKSLFKLWLQSFRIRDPFAHAQVTLVGPLEAETQPADLVIIAGCHEGVWPAPLRKDIWLSPSLETQLGLRPWEDRAAQEAVQFLQALSHPRVLITYSHPREKGRTVPSGFVQRLEGLNPSHFVTQAHQTECYDAWRRLLYGGTITDAQPCKPAPNPPRNLRPQHLSISDVSLILQNPYAFYAKKVLGLKPLETMQLDFSQRLFGIWIHGLLETDTALSAWTPWVPPHWIRQAQKILPWVQQQAQDLSPVSDGREVFFQKSWHGVTLTGRADRLLGTPQDLWIIDYKTGAIPPAKALLAGKAPQLPLLALLASPEHDHAKIQLAYWDLKNREVKPLKNPDQLLGLYDRILHETLTTFFEADTPFTPPVAYDATTFQHSYQHLERASEWLRI